MEDRNNNLKRNVLKQIKAGKVKLRSRYVFLAEKIALGSTFVLSVLLATLSFSLALFYLKSTDSLVYLSFGRGGLYAFLESFPYWLIITFVFLVAFLGFILRKTDFSYKKSFGVLVLSILVFVVFNGTVIAYSNVSEKIDRKINNGDVVGSIFRPFINKPFKIKNNGIVGRVVEIKEDKMRLEMPYGSEDVLLSSCINCDTKINEGDFIVGIGKRTSKGFVVLEARVINPDRMPILRKRTNSRFGYWECNGTPSSSPCVTTHPRIRQCAKDCLDKGLGFEECRTECSNF